MINSWWTDTQSWSVLLGVLAPLLTALVNRPSWSKSARQAVAVAVAVVLGVGQCLAEGTLTSGMRPLAVVAIVAAASHLSYKTLTGHIAGAVERATSPKNQIDQTRFKQT